MTELSQPSDTASRKDGRESTSQADEVRAERQAKQRPRSDEPTRLSESIQNPILHCRLSADQLAERTRMVELDGERRKAETHQRSVDALWAKCDAPARQRDRVEFDNDEWLSSRAQLVGMVGSGSIIGLIGNRGNGKTQLAVEAMRESCEQERACKYVKALDVFLAIREAYQDKAKTELQIVRTFEMPALLVIDELQERGESAWEDRILTHIIDKRYAAMRDTILIANLTPDRFREQVGASISDRLRETGGIIPCTWGSFRKGMT